MRFFQLLVNSVTSGAWIIYDRGKWPILYSVCLVSIFLFLSSKKRWHPPRNICGNPIKLLCRRTKCFCGKYANLPRIFWQENKKIIFAVMSAIYAMRLIHRTWKFGRDKCLRFIQYHKILLISSWSNVTNSDNHETHIVGTVREKFAQMLEVILF